jgi:hypothetical protein
MSQPDLKQLNGIMDTDNPNSVINPMHHKYAKNIRFRNGVIQGVCGTRQFAYNLPTGQNQCIGSFYDPIRQRMIWFNWNSNNRHGIYQYDIDDKELLPLLICYTDSQSDILNFDLDYPVASVVMLYTTEEDGDIIHWTDRRNRPMKLNLKDALADLYGMDWIVDYITVNRTTPSLPPQCSYADDVTVTINNLKSKLYQFRYRYWYKYNNKSTWSSWSKLFAPADPDDLAVDTDPTKNNRIDIIVNTGGLDCIKIEIAFRQSESTNFSDPYSAVVLDKNELSIIDNGLYTFHFFNDGGYPPIDILLSNLLWSYVPQLANAMELLNGNVIDYGGVTEGYDYDEEQDIDVTISTVSNAGNPQLSFITSNFNWYFEDPLPRIYRGTQALFSGDMSLVTGVTLGVQYEVDFVTYSYTSFYTYNPGDTIQDMVAFFRIDINANATGFNAYTLTDNNPDNTIDFNTIVVTADTIDFVLGSLTMAITISQSSTSVSDINISIFHPASRYRWGRVYFDEFDETNGVVTTEVLNIETPELNTTSATQMNVPKITFQVNDQPPIWAKKFSWVLTNSMTFGNNMHTVSAATDKDADFGYLNITNQNINQNKYPSYGYTKGDRCRVIGRYLLGTVNLVDVPVVDLVTTPNINGVNKAGQWLKVPYSAGQMSSFGTSGHDHYAIEIYTPALNTTPDLQTYFEIGEQYPILNPGAAERAHGGQTQDQIIGTQPAIYVFTRGDFYIRERKLPLNANLTGVNTIWIIDQSVSDQYPSKVKNNGRAYVIDPSARHTFYGTRHRWGQKYQQNTNINETNIFYPLNLDEIDRSKGDIQRMATEERLLYIYQNRGVGNYGIYARYIQNNQGQSELISTDDIITVGNIDYLQGDYGIGEQFCSLVKSSNVHYFADPVRGYLLRRSSDGLTPISELNLGQYYIRSLIVPYNNTWLRPDGSKAKILGCYDFFEEQYMPILQPGTRNGDSIDPYCFSFNEKRNGFCSFYDIINPDWAMSAESKVYFWKNGQFYCWDNEEAGNWSKFFGIKYYPSITLVFNDKIAIKKTYEALAYQGNQYWTSPTNGDIVTSQPNPQTGLPQISQLKEFDFDIEEGLRYAAFWRDANSMMDAREALVNGDFLKGTSIEVKLTYYGNDFANLYLPYVKYDLSSRNL